MRESKDLVTWLAAISCVKLNSGSGNSATGGLNIRRKLFSAEIEKNAQLAIVCDPKSSALSKKMILSETKLSTLPRIYMTFGLAKGTKSMMLPIILSVRLN